MKKSILSLGQSLNKAEQKMISGGIGLRLECHTRIVYAECDYSHHNNIVDPCTICVN